jgi:hypothetical protein
VSIGTVAKIYLILLAIANSITVLGTLGINEPINIFPSTLSFWALNVVSFTIFLILPILIVAMDNYIAYLILSGIYFTRILLESFTIIAWTPSLNFIYMPLYGLAIIFCLAIVVNKVSLEVAGKILNLSWTQF